MAGFGEAVRDAARTGLCNYLNFAENGRSWVNEISPVSIPDFGKYVRRLACDNPDPLPGPPSLEGGQCPGVAYRYRWLVDGGAVGIVESGQSPRVATGPLTLTDNGAAPGDLYEAFINGVNFYRSNPYDPDAFNFEIFGIERLDGLPDDCGDQPVPPPPPFPPGGDTVSVTVNWTTNEGDTFIETGDLRIFAPVVIAPVTVIAPVRIELPDISFDGNIVLSPDFNIELKPPSFRRGPGDTDAPPPPENPDTSPTTPQDDSTRRVIGAIATVTSDPSNGLATEVGSADGPDLFVPRMGTLSFRVRAASSLSWTAPFDIKTTRQFIPAPENVQVLDAIASPNPNYSIAVTLVYSDSQPSS